MWPEVHRVGLLQFTLYEVMRGAAIAASLTVCILLNRKQGIPARRTLVIAAVAAPLSIAAARLLNALEYGATLGNLGSEFMRNEGSSIYGALFACLVSVVALAPLMDISTLRFLDAAAPAIALGEAVSRIGCFGAGCCYGETWSGPWAVVFPGGSFATADQRRRGLLDSTTTNSLPVHPVQLYGVVLMVILMWVLIQRFRQPHAAGDVFFWLLVGYGAYRLAISPFRVEVLSSMKFFSVIFIIAGSVGLALNRRLRLAT